jgi:hypothetical protein
MTQAELLARARIDKPNVRYAGHRNGKSIAAWVGRWVPVAGLGINNKWYAMTSKVLVNGEPIHKQEDWVE